MLVTTHCLLCVCVQDPLAQQSRLVAAVAEVPAVAQGWWKQGITPLEKYRKESKQEVEAELWRRECLGLINLLASEELTCKTLDETETGTAGGHQDDLSSVRSGHSTGTGQHSSIMGAAVPLPPVLTPK